MPPKKAAAKTKKQKPKEEDDDYLPELEDEDFESEAEPEEPWDPDYQENHLEEDTKKRPKLVDDDDDEEEIKKPKEVREDGEEADDDEDDEDDVGDLVDYIDIEGEEEINPPLPQLIKNLVVIPPDERTTSERLSIFECGRILGDRARHLDNKARPYIDITGYTSSLEIAFNELIQKRIPMAVIRHVGQNKVEIWRLSEMTLPKLPPPEWFTLASS